MYACMRVCVCFKASYAPYHPSEARQEPVCVRGEEGNDGVGATRARRRGRMRCGEMFVNVRALCGTVWLTHDQRVSRR